MNDFEQIIDWDTWSTHLNWRCPLPKFIIDDKRHRILELIKDTSSTLIRISGPPGVGKTRAVFHGLQGHEGQVWYCREPTVALRALRSRWTETIGPMVFVVDNICSDDVDALAEEFLQAPRSSRMILIGVSDRDVDQRSRTPISSIELGTMNPGGMTELVQQLGLSADQGALCDGHPLFAVWLAAPEIPWRIARRVLVGPMHRHNSRKNWNEECDLRSKALILLMITGHLALDWHQLWTNHGYELGQALGSTSDKLEQAALKCMERKILRNAGEGLHIIPGVLVKMILGRFLSPGPYSLEPRIRHHTPQFVAQLHRVMNRSG